MSVESLELRACYPPRELLVFGGLGGWEKEEEEGRRRVFIDITVRLYSIDGVDLVE